MERKRKLPFDPQVFLSKVNGGRSVVDYRKGQIVYTQGEPADSVFYIQSGKVKEDRRLRAGEGSRSRTSGNRRFLWGGVLDRRASAFGNSLRYDAIRDRANSKGRHHPRDPQRAGVCRAIYRAPLGPQQSCRGGLGRSAIQFERETSGADSSTSGEFRQGRQAGASDSENQ